MSSSVLLWFLLNRKIKANNSEVCKSLFVSSLHSHHCLYWGKPTLKCPSYNILQCHWVLRTHLLKMRKRKIPQITTSRWVSSQSSGNPGTHIVQEVYQKTWSSESYPALKLPWAQTEHLRVGDVRRRGGHLNCRCWFHLENRWKHGEVKAAAYLLCWLWLTRRCILKFETRTVVDLTKLSSWLLNN